MKYSKRRGMVYLTIIDGGFNTSHIGNHSSIILHMHLYAQFETLLVDRN